MLTKPLDI